MPIRNEEETVFLYLWPFGSFPETRRVIGEALVTMLPSLMLGHMIFTERLAAILTLLVLLRYTSALVTFFQIKQLRTETMLMIIAGGLSLSLDRAYFLVVIPLYDQFLQKFRTIVGEIQFENSHTSVVSLLHDSCL